MWLSSLKNISSYSVIFNVFLAKKNEKVSPLPLPWNQLTSVTRSAIRHLPGFHISDGNSVMRFFCRGVPWHAHPLVAFAFRIPRGKGRLTRQADLRYR